MSIASEQVPNTKKQSKEAPEATMSTSDLAPAERAQTGHAFELSSL
jgi:hypothetical protein